MSSSLATTTPNASTRRLLLARAPVSEAKANGPLPDSTAAALASSGLPKAGAVLAVTARPGVESAGLGGLLYAFGAAGARLSLLSLTRGEASPYNSTSVRLEAVRPWELQLASWLLGISSVAVADFPDGGLGYCPMPELTERVQRAIAEHNPDLVLVLDPAAGDSGDARAAHAAYLAAVRAGVPVAARTAPGAQGGCLVRLGAETEAARAVQRSATRAHASQSEALPEALSAVDSLGDREQLRWLVPSTVGNPGPRLAEPVPARGRYR